MEPVHAVLLVIVNVPIFILLGKVFFGSWAGFGEAVWYNMMPDLLSLVTGRFRADLVAELKLMGWGFCCAGAIFGELYLWRMFAA